MLRIVRTPASLLLALPAIFLVPGISQADIVWNITFMDQDDPNTVGDDSTGIGFDDPTFGDERRSTFVAVTDYLNTVLDHSGTVDFVVNNSLILGPQPDPDDNGPLAFAGTQYFTGPNGLQNGILFDRATTGSDANPGAPEGQATFDFGYNYNSEMDDPAGSEFDLFSITLHEITHALGFSSLITQSGTSGISGGDPGVFSVFDGFLVRGATALDDIVTTAGDFVGSTADLISNDLFFNGTNAVAANGGDPVPVYSPNPFRPGSSLSHIVQTGGVMQFSIASGAQNRTYSAQDLGILADLGWSVITPAAIPEPSSALLLGLVALGGVTWRKRRFSIMNI